MMNFLQKISTIGIQNSPKNEHKKINFLNVFILVWLVFMIPFILEDYIVLSTEKFKNNLVLHITTLAVLITVFFIQYKGYLIIARVLFVLLYIYTAFMFCIADSGKFIEIAFVIAPLLSLIFIKEFWINIFIFLLSFLCHISLFKYLDNYQYFEPSTVLIFAIYVGAYFILNYSQRINREHELALAQERDKVLSDKIILEKQEIQLRELNEFKSHFFVNLSHEIRTPITLIKGYTSKIKLGKNDKNQENLNIVTNQIKQIEGILNNILDLSKLDANKLTLQKINTEFNSFIIKHHLNFKNIFAEEKIALNLSIHCPPVKVYMDATLVSKSINNLLSNALKFTPENGTVDINVMLHHDDLLISIVDNGLGIPKHDLHKIFERFYQSENDITLSQGSGIGLSFTKSILDAHGFSIAVTSVPDVKTEFTITIPKQYITSLNEVDITNNYTSEAITNIISNNYENEENRPTILVVDDHKQMRSYIKSILNNYNIIEAENGREALTILKTQTIDLLLTDYMMPIMDGEVLVKKVKKLDLKIPVIIITARVDGFGKLNMLRIGVDGYLNKPFVEEELLLIIKNSLKAYHTIITFEEELEPEEKEDINLYTDTFNEKISKFIHKNMAQTSFGVQDVADYFNISKSTLNRKVKTVLGQTTQQLITQARIEKARELQLKNQTMSKKEIANTVGVSNAGHLFKKLSEIYGNHYQN